MNTKVGDYYVSVWPDIVELKNEKYHFVSIAKREHGMVVQSKHLHIKSGHDEAVKEALNNERYLDELMKMRNYRKVVIENRLIVQGIREPRKKRV